VDIATYLEMLAFAGCVIGYHLFPLVQILGAAAIAFAGLGAIARLSARPGRNQAEDHSVA
jgi:hypothetical protein